MVGSDCIMTTDVSLLDSIRYLLLSEVSLRLHLTVHDYSRMTAMTLRQQRYLTDAIQSRPVDIWALRFGRTWYEI